MRRKMTAIAALAALAFVPQRAAATEQQQRHHGRGPPPPPQPGGRRRRLRRPRPRRPPRPRGQRTLATLDKNGDGKVVFGVATPGPRDDGAYYQALVDGVTKFSEDNGFETPVVVDNIPAADAATQLENLARQNVGAVMVGAGRSPTH
jgi:ABC-type sugar transport system substrate-binding protein